MNLVQHLSNRGYALPCSAQYARAEEPLSRLLEMLPIPFLPTPMGKGLISDKHPMCISAARSTALSEADVVLIVGARLNWILHYGHPPKWNQDVKLIRLDINAESIDDNKSAEVALLGDASAIIDQLCHALGSEQPVGDPFAKMPNNQASWYKRLLSTCHNNSQKLIEKAMVFPRWQRGSVDQVALPLTYHQAFNIIRKNIPADHVFIGEGANTMDIARTMFDVVSPRSRLDAGTQATMGVGMGYCIAAAIQEQQRLKGRSTPRPVVAVVGDSAFGFSGLEIETAVRNKLGMLIIVMNNGGVCIQYSNSLVVFHLPKLLSLQVYKGLPPKAYNDIPVQSLPPTALLPELRYDHLCVSLGGLGHCVRRIDELEKAVKDGIGKQEEGRVTLINVLMDSGSKKK
jgi:2-hydroxyacyl-CoA lyase 1